MDYVLIILFYAAVVIFIVRIVRKIKDKKKRPKNDAQKELVRDVIAAIERDAPNFYEAEVFPSYSSSSGVSYTSMYRTIPGCLQYRYSFDEHGYYVSKEMAYILACQIADHFGGRCDGSYSPGEYQYCQYHVDGPRKLALERERKQRNELERQRIENLKHL